MSLAAVEGGCAAASVSLSLLTTHVVVALVNSLLCM